MGILQFLGFIILGGAVLVGGVVALCIVIARSTAHDINKCECVDCKRRRNVRFLKRQAKQDLPEPTPLEGWLSTRQLRQEMIINHRGNRYQVIDLSNTEYGRVVSLAHIPTRKNSIVPIALDALDRKMWNVERYR